VSQTKVWPSDHSTVVRLSTAGAGSGDGHGKHLLSGRGGSSPTYDYRSYTHYAIDWSDVGKVLRATLVLFADDHTIFDAPTDTEVPRVALRRMTSGAKYGTHVDGAFASADYTVPTVTTTGQKLPVMASAVDGVTRIDITDWVNMWAPKTVKQSTGAAGPAIPAYGIALDPYSRDTKTRWSGWSFYATDSNVRPYIELVYERGLTAPNTPTGLLPTGANTSIGAWRADFSDSKGTDTLAATEVEVYTAAAVNVGQVVTGGVRVYTQKKTASATEIENARSNMVPDNLHLTVNTTYKWRVRQTDQSGQVSPWTNLTSISVTNTDPNAPTLTPASGTSKATLNGVLFRGGTFSDPDAGNTLLAFQVQMSAVPEGSLSWDDADALLWDTGKVYVAAASVSWQRAYGGASLAAGTYYWRARQWDSKDGVSSWAYATLIVTADFDPQPGAEDRVQIDPRTPWKVVIRDMGVLRAPGNVVAVFEHAKSVGASIVYNSPGEAHFTLLPDDPQMSVVEPKQTHYSIQFYGADGWKEKFAGVVWDVDATEQDVVFLCIDYLALYDTQLDERYDPASPDKSAEKGGSKYVDKTITQVVTDQLTRAKNLPNSPVGFITVGPIAAMNEHVTMWTTMQSPLAISASLIDSHRQGQGKRTRIKVKRTGEGAYSVVVEDDPGRERTNLRLKYGELVQGYRIVFFGKDWGSVTHVIGRDRNGSKVFYKTASAPGVDQSVYGRIARLSVVDGVSDENDVIRRTKQAAIHYGKLGRSMGLGIRSGFLQPLDGYDITDSFPVSIKHGAVDTERFGSGFWDCYAIAWEAGDQQQQSTNLTFLPREDTSSPDADLIPSSAISPQAEWQLGWTPPDITKATSKYWLDQNTGIVYLRDDDTLTPIHITGTA
jgi:hypothetical protein